MPAAGAGSETIRLSVAGLGLVLDARGSGIRMAAPPAHAKFEADGGLGALALAVRDGRLRPTDAWRPLHAPPDAWQLWLDEEGRYVFSAGRHSPPARQVTVDAAFRSGEVLGAFVDGETSAGSFYPLEGVDIMLFINWLADSGDLILHASGFEESGRGYAFAGASGAGKSTLAAAFLDSPGKTVLGEDNLILRHLEGRFWLFGTPWHLKPAHCSPLGVPLEKLFFLDRFAGAGVAPCAPLDGIARLLQTAFVPYYRPKAVARILDNLALLAERVPLFTLGYRLGDDVMALLGDA